MDIKFLVFFVVGFLIIIFITTIVLPNMMSDLESTVNDHFKVCLSCGKHELKETAVCEKCRGTDFAVNWCKGCQSVFEDDVDYTFCPICGRKQ